MDTSADVIRKATSDKEKEDYRREGRCFECGKQGHLAKDCPSKKDRTPRARSSRTVEIQEDKDLDDSKSEASSTPSLAVRVAQLTEEERHAFMDEMRSLGEDMGFLDA